MQKKSFGFFSHSHSPIHRYIFIVGHSSTFFLVVFAVVLVVFVAHVEWNSINIRPLTCILQAKSLPQSFISSCCLKYDNIIISSIVSVCTDVYLISDCEWSSKKDELANTEYLMLLNITKWNAMRCDTIRWDEMQCMIFFYLVYLVIIVQRCCLISLYWLKNSTETKKRTTSKQFCRQSQTYHGMSHLIVEEYGIKHNNDSGDVEDEVVCRSAVCNAKVYRTSVICLFLHPRIYFNKVEWKWLMVCSEHLAV